MVDSIQVKLEDRVDKQFGSGSIFKMNPASLQ